MKRYSIPDEFLMLTPNAITNSVTWPRLSQLFGEDTVFWDEKCHEELQEEKLRCFTLRSFTLVHLMCQKALTVNSLQQVVLWK